MCVLINTSEQRRTLVDYEGVWALEHQGLSSTSSELRLQLTGEDGKAEEMVDAVRLLSGLDSR